MDLLVDIHSWLRWIVLLDVVGAAGYGFVVAKRAEVWNAPLYSITVMIVDIQVTLGIVLYLFNQGWDQGFFIAVLHPLFMLAALAVAHIGMSRARSAEAPAAAYRTVSVALLVSLVLVVLGIPWER